MTREDRIARRKKRRERIAKLLGMVAGAMFNVRWIGWIIGAAVIAVVLVIISRLL